MPSKSASNGITQLLDPNDSHTPLFLPTHSSSHRTSSFSSLSSLSSNESPIFTPKSLLHSTARIPFSWEELPGLPKRQPSKRVPNLLPLPPPPIGNRFPYRKLLNSEEFLMKKYDGESCRKDPFLAALIECSKDDDHNQQYDPIFGKISKKIGRSLTEGFALSTSCKSSCAVSDSMVLVPKCRKQNIVPKRSPKSISGLDTPFS